MQSLLVAVALLGLSSFSAGAQAMIYTGECQRFDGIVVFPLRYVLHTDDICSDRYGGHWVRHVVPENAVPDVIRQAREPVFLPYEMRR